jgi:stage II sporulation protein AA (anti-sigma F factor antagonist)
MTSTQPAPFSIDVECRSHGLFVVRLIGELDMASAPDLGATLRRTGGAVPFHVVVDLSRLTFIDSSGLNALVASSRAVERAGGSIVFAEPSAHVARILEIVQLPDTVRVEESVEDAVRAADR